MLAEHSKLTSSFDFWLDRAYSRADRSAKHARLALLTLTVPAITSLFGRVDCIRHQSSN